jgi:hypothetical protein
MKSFSILRTSLALSGAAVLLSSPSASAQSFNIDFADNLTLGTPSNTYGAGSGQAGYWNDVVGDIVLADLSGNVTGVSIALVGVDTPYGFDELCTGGEDEALMDDIIYTSGLTGYFLITGLADGCYDVYTYAMAPDDATFLTDVSVLNSPDPLQAVGGDFCAGYAHLSTHAIHSVQVSGGSAQIDVAVNANYTSLNGMQIIQTSACGGSAGTAFCFGEAAACPCANAGSAESGCANGSGAGAILDGSGSASISADDLVLESSQLIPNQPGLYFQGNNAVNTGLGVPFGDGLRCAGGGVIRLQVRFADANGGSATNISVATKGGCAAGDVKRYQIWYRDPATTPCGAQFNLSNGYEITWEA